MTSSFDSHAHIQEPEFADDLDDVLSSGRAQPVSKPSSPVGGPRDGARPASRWRSGIDGLYATRGYPSARRVAG